MQRIPYPDMDTQPELVRERLAAVPLNIVRICAHASVPLFDAQGRMGAAIADPEVLDPRLREAVILRVAHLSNSAYELHHHVSLGKAAGLTQAELDALASGDYATLDPLLAAAARFTEEVVSILSPSDATLRALRALVPDRIVVNIVLTIGCYMSIARLIAVTGIELDADALEHLPDQLEEAP
jgi:4-carboxymuconolactone decarboxylase